MASKARRQRIEQCTDLGSDEETPSPEALWLKEQRLEVLNRALRSLPPRFRAVLILRFWRGCSYAWISTWFKSKGIIVSERQLKRWTADALVRCGKAVHAAERGAQKGEL